MKTAKWESSSGALLAFLQARPQAATICDLYTIVPAGAINGGAALCFTTADTDIVVPYSPPVTYSSKLVYFDQMANKAFAHWKIGLDVDSWQVVTAPSPQATIGNQPWLAALRGRALAGATVTIDRAFFDTRSGPLAPALTRTPLGVLNVFTGFISEIDIGRTNAVISIESPLKLLSYAMPRNLLQAGCRWTLYGPGCTLVQASFAVGGTIASAPAAPFNPVAVSVAAPGGSGTYTLGQLTMTSGQNEGFSRAIRQWNPVSGANGTFLLLSPFPFPLTVGDTFTAYPGCNKTVGSCTAFDNFQNFGGMDQIPPPEYAVEAQS